MLVFKNLLSILHFAVVATDVEGFLLDSPQKNASNSLVLNQFLTFAEFMEKKQLQQ